MKRTASFDVDGEPFEFVCDITKATTLADGRRIIRGVASGVAEDRDGERVSRHALEKMARQPLAGGAVKITSSHDQDWLTEFGDVIKVEHDRKHDELLVEAELPPEGVDPIADKAWLKANSEKLGFSIGGKLRKAYYELAERGGKVVKRKVLDEIDLRHVALTKKPSYRTTFAECVAKTFDAPAPDDADEFVDADLFKAAPDADQPPAPAPDQAPADAPPAGTGDTAQPPSDAEAAGELPEAKRHLSCPQCGCEFAAPLPKNAGDMTGDSPNPDTEDDEGDAHKSAQEDPMDTITETVEKLRTLADTADAEVSKTDDTPEPEAVETDQVAKTETDDADGEVLKMLAASHRANAGAIEDLATNTNAALEAVAKAIGGLVERMDSLPIGRKSVARVIPPAVEVEKSATETDDVAKAIADPNASPLDVLKAQNKQRGIH